MRDKRSFSDIEVLKVKLYNHIQSCMEMYDSLLSYQIDLVNPLKKEPFCLTCGEDLEEKYIEGTWKCDNCRKDKFQKMLRKQRQNFPQGD